LANCWSEMIFKLLCSRNCVHAWIYFDSYFTEILVMASSRRWTRGSVHRCWWQQVSHHNPSHSHVCKSIGRSLKEWHNVVFTEFNQTIIFLGEDSYHPNALTILNSFLSTHTHNPYLFFVLLHSQSSSLLYPLSLLPVHLHSQSVTVPHPLALTIRHFSLFVCTDNPQLSLIHSHSQISIILW
jgi:hypothetical protein